MDKCSDSTGDSSDDEPLTKLIKKPQTDAMSKTSQSELLNSQSDSRKASDDSTGDSSSDNEPLIKKTVRLSLPVKMPHSNRSKGTHKTKNIADSTDDSSDDEPLTKFIKQAHADDQSNTTQSEVNPQPTSNKDGLNTSDDEPLIKMERTSLPVKMPAESSDDEQLIRNIKKPSTAAERTASLPLKKRPVNRARKNSNVNQSRDKHTDSTSDSSDDKPLSNIVKNLKTQTQRKTPPSAARKSPRKVPNKLQRSGESWDSSDDEPLIRTTRKSPRRGTSGSKRGRRVNSNRHVENKLRKGEDEDPDDEPLIVKKPRKKTRTPIKRKLVPDSTAVSRKRSYNRAVNKKITCASDPSSDDEPLIKLVKKSPKRGKKTTAPAKRPIRSVVSRKIPDVAIKERSRRNIKPVQYTSKGSSNDSSDDEPLITMVKKPLITKTLMLELERIEDVCENYNRGNTSTDVMCGGKGENPVDELLVKIKSPPEPLGERMDEDRGKREVNCDKEP